jgi:hypothetical protein
MTIERHARIAAFCLVMLGNALAIPSAGAGAFRLTSSGALEGPTVLALRTYSYFLGDAPFPLGFTSPTLTTNGQYWKSTVTDQGPGNLGGRSLQVQVQHTAPFGLGPQFTFDFPTIKPPPQGLTTAVYGEAAQANHGNDFDIARATVNVGNQAEPPAAAQIVIRAAHPSGRVGGIFPNFGWSLQNPAGNPALQAIRVVPSYRDSQGVFDGSAIPPPPALPGGRGTGGTLPGTALRPGNNDPADIGRLSDYRLRAAGSPETETTLAFLGDIDGQVNKLDLAAATSIFTDDGHFLVPLFDRGTTPLYVGVDLTQWLSAPASFMPNPGDIFNIGSDGTSPLLPGFMFSNAPINFVPGIGYQNTDAVSNENLTVRAFIDGENVVPEPSTLYIFGVGLLLAMRAGLRLWEKGSAL